MREMKGGRDRWRERGRERESVCTELLSFRRTRIQMMVPERSLVEDRESSEGERDV
jgi:hypothetical protein